MSYDGCHTAIRDEAVAVAQSNYSARPGRPQHFVERFLLTMRSVRTTTVFLAGLLVPLLRILYDYAWFVGFGVEGMVYVSLMQRAEAPARLPEWEPSRHGQRRFASCGEY